MRSLLNFSCHKNLLHTIRKLEKTLAVIGPAVDEFSVLSLGYFISCQIINIFVSFTGQWKGTCE